MTDIFAARTCPEMLEYLLRRRSVPLKDMGEPGPDDAQINILLRAASRVPDHGKMFPWHFIAFTGPARELAGNHIAAALKLREPDAAPAKLELESGRFTRAPLVIGVISRMRRGKNPLWEQILSAGAACQNLSLAAHAMGFGVNWLTEWYAYDPHFKAAIGLDARDHVAGFMFIGTPAKQPEERDRPDLARIVTFWDGAGALNNGESFDHAEFEFPKPGFDFSKLY